MTTHILKLCVGVDDVADLAAWQARTLRNHPAPFHQTRMVPKRRDDVLDGGSIYWVIKGVIQVRQRIVDIREIIDRTERRACELVFDPELVRVEPTPKRAFQGWRYYQPEDAPRDLTDTQVDAPPELLSDLKDAMVW